MWNSGRQSMDAPGLIPPLIGAPLSPRSGGVAGTVEDLLVDAASHRPVWLLVRLHDSAQPYTFVPAERMASRTGAVVVPFDEKALREAPVRLASPSGCAREHATMLSRHYGVRVPPRRGARAARCRVGGGALARLRPPEHDAVVERAGAVGQRVRAGGARAGGRRRAPRASRSPRPRARRWGSASRPTTRPTDTSVAIASAIQPARRERRKIATAIANAAVA